MKGKLVKKYNKWFVKHFEDWVEHNYFELHPDDVKQIEEDSYMFDNIEARIAAYPDVEFELVQEPNTYRSMGNITNPYMAYAKLVSNEQVDENGYPVYGKFGKEETIEEAAIKAFPKIYTPIEMLDEEEGDGYEYYRSIFINGAKSNAAREMWIKSKEAEIYWKEKFNDNNERNLERGR